MPWIPRACPANQRENLRFPAHNAPVDSGSSAARQQGVVVDWNDRRGFGFIDSAGGGARLFVHASAFPRARRPVTGSKVTFVEAHDERGRPEAADVKYAVAPRRGVAAKPVLIALAVASLFGAVLAFLWTNHQLSGWVVLADAILSIAAFSMYASDKAAAVKGEWRTPELTLHVVALVGGWPGALVARQYLRHKTRKEPFSTIFWLTVAVNCGSLVWIVALQPSALS